VELLVFFLEIPQVLKPLPKGFKGGTVYSPITPAPFYVCLIPGKVFHPKSEGGLVLGVPGNSWGWKRSSTENFTLRMSVQENFYKRDNP
jgi:hypothetical protein